MASNPRRTIAQRTNLMVLPRDAKASRKPARSLTGRVVSTTLALMALAIILRYLPPSPRNAQVQTADVSIGTVSEAVQLGKVQMSQPPADEALYLDGVLTNNGTANITGAKAQVDFRDADGDVVSRVEKPIAGMTHGGTDLVQDEFVRNPIQPRETRFFRVAIDQTPANWNHELPELRIVEVKAQ